jgi:signal transduction histidine kinase
VADTAVAAAALATELPFYFRDGPFLVALELVIAACIALRRVWTLAASVAFGVAFVLQAVISPDPPEDQLCLLAIMMLAYAWGSRYPWPWAVLGFVLVAGSACLHEFFNEHDYAFPTAITAVGWIPGLVVGQRKTELRLLQEQTAVLEREQDAREQAAATAERARLARELHDVVSHSVSAMVVQAGAAREVLAMAPERVDLALERVQETGQQAIVELHQLLGLLREAGSDPAALGPTPGLGSLDRLLSEVREFGQHVELELIGHRRPLPAALELSAFRVVQESLTNARKHAPRAKASVQVNYGDEQLEVVVADEGDPYSPRSPGGGLGLLGLRERVALVGGRFEARPRDGGWVVRAVFPIRPPVRPAPELGQSPAEPGGAHEPPQLARRLAEPSPGVAVRT